MALNIGGFVTWKKDVLFVAPRDWTGTKRGIVQNTYHVTDPEMESQWMSAS